MTVSLKIHVGGNYQATVRQSLDGEQIDAYVVGPNEEKYIWFRHGVKNDFSITEAYLGDAAGPAVSTPPPAAEQEVQAATARATKAKSSGSRKAKR